MKAGRAAVFTLFLAAAAPAAAQVAVPDDYRMDHYRAPTPAELPGGTVVDLERTQKLIADEKVWLVFVESALRAAEPPRSWLAAAPKAVIPGSVWLPNVGKGAPEADEIAYFKIRLDAMRAERPESGFLFYCYIDCWVSWNAARRAVRLGYAPVYWYPDGVDGWMLEGLPTERINPAGQP